jgi:acetyl esterase/lipase
LREAFLSEPFLLQRFVVKSLGKFGCVTLIFLGIASIGASGGAKEKRVVPPHEVFHLLWPIGPNTPAGNLAPGNKGKEPADFPGVYIYRPAEPNGAAVVICPGGGYGALAMDHEGNQIGAWLNKHGITGVVLKYRLGPKYNHPIPLWDAQRALRYVRATAPDLKIDPKRIGILGFSAGGHLASTAGTHFDAGNKDAQDPIDRVSCRPDFMVLLYPVITFSDPWAHKGSRNNLLGKDPDPKLIELLNNEKQVTKDTPPTFLAHTHEDSGVRPENSVLFYLALKKNNVPAELHIYEKGPHGLGLGKKDTPFASWPDRCIAWLKDRAMLENVK